MSVNTSKVKDTKDEEPAVTDIEVIKAPGYFKLFKCGKQFFSNPGMAYERVFMVSAKENYWLEFHHIITNYNDWNDTPLSNANIIESITQVILQQRVIAESNNFTVDTFMISPQRNKNDLIDEVANLRINARNKNNLINEVVNMTINDAGNGLN